MSFSFAMPWTRGRADSAVQSSLDTESVFELDPAPKKLASLVGRPPAPAPLPENGFSFPPTVQTSPSELFPFKGDRTSGSDDSLPVSNSSASISQGLDTSSEENGAALPAPRRAAPLLAPHGPRLSPLLSTTDSLHAYDPPSPRLEAAALVAALGRHSPQLRAALVILGYQDLWPSEHQPHRSIEGTLAGVLALARRAGAQPPELTPHFILTVLWILHAFDSQVGGYASDVALRFTALLPREGRAAARSALLRDMRGLQGPLLERCGWRVRLAVSAEVAPALGELRACPGFLPWCGAAHAQLLYLVAKRPLRVQSPAAEAVSKFEAAPVSAATLVADAAAVLPPPAALLQRGGAMAPSALLGAPSSAFGPFVAGDPAPAQAAARQPWRKRLRGVDSAAELPNTQAQKASIASRFHTALRGMFGGSAGGGASLQGPPPEDFGEQAFAEE